MQRSHFVMGLDLAQSNDYTALVALEHRDEPIPPRGYGCVFLNGGGIAPTPMCRS